MPPRASLALYAIPILLVLLTAVAGYAYAQIGSLALPIPKALALFTVVLPLVTGISTQSVNTLIRQTSREKHQLTLPLLAIIGFTLMYDTAIAVLALTHILPPSALTCGLNERWAKLYSAKDARGIRAIQDAFECCGFKTVKDRAFPFTSGASTCAADFKRSSSCLGPWRGAEQWTAGLLLLVAVTVFIIKVLAVVSLLTRSSWTSSKWARALLPNGHEAAEGSDEEGDTRAVVRRLIEDSAGDVGYQDESSAGRALEGLPNGGNGDAGNVARVQPSQLIDVDNEWREEGADRRD